MQPAFRANRLETYLLGAVGIFLVVSMVQFPELAFESAIRGLEVWWEVVFPALLPFFIGGQILMGLGVVRGMGVIMEPFMRPLFNVPGVGSFVIAMGLASGYPIGAVLTTRLRQQGLVNRVEAERLMSFANTADPLFMAGAVAVGMFHNAALAGLIMLAHYLGAVATGFCLRFYGRGEAATPPAAPETGSRSFARRVLDTVVEARTADGRPFGQIMGGAVRDSVNTLLLVGGFIILFSVIIQILTRVGVVDWLALFFSRLLVPFGVDPAAVSALTSGLFEITLGTQAASRVEAGLIHRTLIASAIIAWSGLSVHAQVAAIIQGTDIRILPYIVARGLHAVFASIFTVLLWPLESPTLAPGALPVLAPGGALPALPGWFTLLGSSSLLWLLLTLGLGALTLLLSLPRLALRIIRLR